MLPPASARRSSLWPSASSASAGYLAASPPEPSARCPRPAEARRPATAATGSQRRRSMQLFAQKCRTCHSPIDRAHPIRRQRALKPRRRHGNSPLRSNYRFCCGLMVRDGARAPPHHEVLRPHPRATASPLSLEQPALAGVSKDETHELGNGLVSAGAWFLADPHLDKADRREVKT